MLFSNNRHFLESDKERNLYYKFLHVVFSMN